MDSCSWKPEVIVELVKASAWPLVVLILVISMRSRIGKIVKKLTKRLRIKEISASTSGVIVKIEQQAKGFTESARTTAISTPENIPYEEIVRRHKEQQSEYSNELLESIKRHMDSLNITDQSKIDLMSVEISIQQAILRYVDVSKILFRSQYELLRQARNTPGGISDDDVRAHFEYVQKKSTTGIVDTWDHIKYIAYLIGVGLIKYEDNHLVLKPFGRSYVAFMEKNPNLVDELIKV